MNIDLDEQIKLLSKQLKYLHLQTITRSRITLMLIVHSASCFLNLCVPNMSNVRKTTIAAD